MTGFDDNDLQNVDPKTDGVKRRNHRETLLCKNFVFEDYGLSSHKLIQLLVFKVDEWLDEKKKRKIKLVNLKYHTDLCVRLLSLVKWVADPRWKRCRYWPMIANAALKTVELNVNGVYEKKIKRIGCSFYIWKSVI